MMYKKLLQTSVLTLGLLFVASVTNSTPLRACEGGNGPCGGQYGECCFTYKCSNGGNPSVVGQCLSIFE